MFEYLRLVKPDWLTNSDQGWHGQPPLTVIAVVAIAIVVAYFVLKRN